MGIISGLLYNLKGLRMGFSTGRLLFWGLVRFVLVILLMVALTGLILTYHARIMDLLWERPASPWIVWLWHALSWLVTLFLIASSTLFSYLLSQVFFSVLIMDFMSKITEQKVTGRISQTPGISVWASLLHLICQEIPRTLVPVLLSFLIMIFGWVTPFGPLVTLLSSGLAILFLSWDNTDLVPARQSIPFRARFRFLLETLPFHIGFGLPFLVPILNILFLSFAPVGATLYWIEKQASARNPRESPP